MRRLAPRVWVQAELHTQDAPPEVELAARASGGGYLTLVKAEPRVEKLLVHVADLRRAAWVVLGVSTDMYQRLE